MFNDLGDLIMKLIIYFLILMLSLELSAKTPEIKWWFDTKDASAGQSSAADIDNDGKYEVIFGCYRNDSCVYALNGENGSLLWKYNASTKYGEGCNDVATLPFDIDGDGKIEVIVPSSCNPTTFCFYGETGEVRWASKTRGSDSPPTIADLDGDGLLEILHGEFGGWLNCISALTGEKKWEIPVNLKSWIQTAPTIVDVNNDGQLDIVVATWCLSKEDTNKVYAFDGKTLEKLWEFAVKDVIYHGTAVADLDEDGKIELLIGDYSGEMYVLNGHDGSLKWSHQFGEYYAVSGPVSISDLDGDGKLEIVVSGWFKMIALRNDGSFYWEYQIPDYSSCFRGAALSDIDDDGLPDVIFGTGIGKLIALKGTNGGEIWLVDLAEHYGKKFDLDNAPLVADFDQDGLLDVFVVGGHMEYPEFRNGYGRAYMISAGKGAGPEWLMFQNNPGRNSNYLWKAPSNVENEIDNNIDYIYFDNNSKSLIFQSNTDAVANVELFDYLGNKSFSILNIELINGKNTIDLRNFSNYSSGLYFVRISLANGLTINKKILLF